MYVVSPAKPVNKTEWTYLWPIDYTLSIFSGDELSLLPIIVLLSLRVNDKVSILMPECTLKKTDVEAYSGTVA